MRKEERLFLEIAKRKGAISDAALEKARARARAQSISVIEALVASSGVSFEDADSVRKALLDLSFTCPACDSIDFRELDEPKIKGRRCAECLAKDEEKKTTIPPARVQGPDPRTHAERPPSGERKAASPDSLGSAPTEAGPAPPSRSGGPDEITEGVVLGGCRIEKKIGQGGMGRVYRGHHEGLDREMAVKVIDERLAAKKGFVEQFFAEARTLAKLDHPNVVRIFNVDTDQSKRHFIVMELLEGGSVESLWREKGKKLPLEDAKRIAREAASGLLHAHQAGLIHRDVKPGNLMLGKDGRVKVVDFGLAARTENDVFIATEIAGTPHYMAPEQVDGLRLDARCDQYALGATFYQLLCGRPPFEGARPHEILLAHMKKVPPKPSELREDLPGWVDALVLRMLAKAPEDRYPTLAEVLSAIEAAGATPEKKAPVRERIEINSAEILKLEKGLKAQPVPPPSWRPAAAAIAASLSLAVLFLLVPARGAFGGSGLGLGETPGWVKALEKKAREKASSGRAEDLDAAIGSLEAAIDDMKALAGAATLARAKDELASKKKALAQRAKDALSKDAAALLEAGRLGPLYELADPSSATLAALGLKESTLEWRKRVQDALEKRGEVYVPAGGALPGFYLDRTEVTNEAYARALKLPAPAGPLARKPVTGVTFEEAQACARALGKRLPTSAEWQRAAQGTDGREWPWGARFEPGRANVLDGGSGALEDVFARPKDQSPYGVLGMAGNALEWVAGDEGPLVAGGGYLSSAPSARVTSRQRLEGKDPAVGFRCARGLE